MAETESMLETGETLHRAPSQAPAVGSTEAVPQGEDRYEVTGTLGEGGMGRVVEAIDKQFSRVVAIKELKSGAVDSGRLQAEAMVTGNLEHPGVPPVYERGVRPDGTPFYVMRRVRGRDLEDTLAQEKDLHGRLSHLSAVTRAAQTLGFAHERGVVHRDIKPQNIMVGGHGEVFIVDWGLARASNLTTSSGTNLGSDASTAATKTLMGTVMGTPAYMAPEQARGDISLIDARTDVFALGAVLYRVLAGRPPYDGMTTAQAVDKAKLGEFPSIDQVAPEAPAPLREICTRAMAIDPSKRYPTAQHMADQLQNFASLAVAKAFEGKAGNTANFAIVFGIAATLFGFAGLFRFASDVLWGPHLFFASVFFCLAMYLALLEWRAHGKLGLAPLGFAMSAATMVTGFIAVGFTLLTDNGNQAHLIRMSAVGITYAGLLTALSLGTWGIVMYRRPR